METTQQNTLPMSSFILAGGMKLLLQHATHVVVTPVSLDPHDPENYFVDIRFRFSTKSGRPYFGETGCGMDAVEVPRKLVSKLSDEPDSAELTVLSGRVSDNPASEEALFMPDASWIKRTAALSAILKQEKMELTREKAAEDALSGGTVTTVTSVRGAVRAVQTDAIVADPVLDREFCFDDPAGKVVMDEAVKEKDPAVEVPDVCEDVALEDMREQGAHSSDRGEKKEREDEDGGEPSGWANARKADSDGEMPAGCGMLRSSSVKAAVKTIRRSFSRERLEKTSEKSGDMGSREASGASVNAVEKPRKKRKDKFDDPELLLIQPNPIQPPRKSPTNFEDSRVQPLQGPPLQRVVPKEVPVTPSEGGVEDRADRVVERDETVARGLFRRTSNLARNIVRRLSSNDKGFARQASGERDEDPNNLGRFAKRRSWLGRRESADDIGRRPGMVVPEASIESTQEPYRVHKRRSLIFGRRYKN